MRDILDSAFPTLAIAETSASLPATVPNDELSSFYVNRLQTLWRDFFRNPSHWVDIRSTKTDPRSPDFKHKSSGDKLWIFDWLNPCWVQEEIKQRGFKAATRSENAKYGTSCSESDIPSIIEEDRSDCQGHGANSSLQNLQSGSPESDRSTAVKPGQFLEPSATCVPNPGLQNNEEDIRACIVLVAALKACADQGDLLRGISIHTHVARQGLLGSNPIIGNAVINMYAKCSALSKAQEVFDLLPVRNVVAWNTLIAGYTQNQHSDKALKYFERMQGEGIHPDAVTVVCVLSACGSVRNIEKGRELHALIIKEGLLDINVVVGNALIDMYSGCHLLAKAQAILFELPFRNAVSWTALITGFVQHRYGKEALICFESMKSEGFPMSMSTSLTILKACGIEGAVHKGQEIHCLLVKDGLLGVNMMVGTALVDMYAKCGALAEAQNLFYELPMQDVVAWGALLDGFSQHADGEEAIQCYTEMRQGGFSPDGATFICILQASGSIGASHTGQQIHAEIAAGGWFDQDPAVGNSLIDMYAKCGMLAEAQDVFDELLVQSAITWNALIAGYAQLGEEAIVLRLYNRMVVQGTKPDVVTFIVLFIACSHKGLLSTGQAQFEDMIADFGIAPTSEHLTCVVDLFGRAGLIDKALRVVEVMPVRADLSTLLAVLGACKRSRNKWLGAWALEQSLQAEKKYSSAHVCISDIYAVFGKQEDVKETDSFSGEEWLANDPEYCW